MFTLSASAQVVAGIVLLAAISVASGGLLLTNIIQGRVEVTDFQKAFYRAGHAHAGVLIMLGLLCLLFTETTSLTGIWPWLSRTGVLIAAILMPAGFFFSAMGAGRTKPSRWIILLGVGAVFLVAGLATWGVGLLLAAAS